MIYSSDNRIFGARLLLAVSMSLFAANVSMAENHNVFSNTINSNTSHTVDNNNASSNTINSNVEPNTLSCQSQSCKNRQHRRILRAQCRLEGGWPSNGGRTCTIREPGVD